MQRGWGQALELFLCAVEAEAPITAPLCLTLMAVFRQSGATLQAAQLLHEFLVQVLFTPPPPFPLPNSLPFPFTAGIHTHHSFLRYHKSFPYKHKACSLAGSVAHAKVSEKLEFEACSAIPLKTPGPTSSLPDTPSYPHMTPSFQHMHQLKSPRAVVVPPARLVHKRCTCYPISPLLTLLCNFQPPASLNKLWLFISSRS